MKIRCEGLNENNIHFLLANIFKCWVYSWWNYFARIGRYGLIGGGLSPRVGFESGSLPSAGNWVQATRLFTRISHGTEKLLN